MYIPYEIGDTVYYFPHCSNSIEKGVIEEFIVKEKETLVRVTTTSANRLNETLPIHRIYPRKAIAKEELLARVVNYANENLIDTL